MPFTTAWTGLIDIAKLAAKDTVLITAASSGVGLAAIQMSRQEGAIPIALTRRSGRADALLQAGAAHVIATEEKDVEEEVKRLTDGKGATVVFDTVGRSVVREAALRNIHGWSGPGVWRAQQRNEFVSGNSSLAAAFDDSWFCSEQHARR
jgi:NADPH:quinone reductase-like Zn-dependent oxidoreductase